MTLQEFKRQLVEIPGVAVYHITAAPEEGSGFLCWQEMLAEDIVGDNTVIAKTRHCQLDYFTEQEYSVVPARIEAYVRGMGVCLEAEDQSYDPDRNEWRYIWQATFLDVINDGTINY